MAIRQSLIPRDRAKFVLTFLGQPVGRSVVKHLKQAREAWETHRESMQLLAALEGLAKDYAKADSKHTAHQIKRDDLHLVCFKFVSA